MKKIIVASIIANLAFLASANAVGANPPAANWVRAPTGVVEQKLTQNDGFEIGHSVAIAGNTALVGAPKSNSNKGAAYVYTRTCPTCTWTLAQRLTASDGTAPNRFGDAVAFDGATMLVGATNAPGSGAAYTFINSGGTWVQSQKLLPHDGAAQDQFGYAVAISGPHIFVGAFNTAHSGAGAAYRYYRAGAVGGAFLEAEELSASDGVYGDEFGWSVAATADHVFIGARNVNTSPNTDCPHASLHTGCPGAGAVYVFDNPCSLGNCQPHWLQAQRLIAPSPMAGMNFGFSVAIEGTTGVVSAPYTYVGLNIRQGVAFVHSKQVGGWAEQEELIASDGMAHDQFGTALAINGANIAVGAEFANPNSAGAAYVFKPSGLTWNQTNKLTASDTFHLGGYGIFVGYSGNTVLVGAPYTPDGSRGAAYSYIVP